MGRIRHIIEATTLVALLAACNVTAEKSLQATDLWARPGLAQGNSAIFLIIDNPGGEDRLASAESDVAEAVELHRTIMQDGVMSMEQQTMVAVPTGKTEFEPGGLHIMLIGLKRDLVAGDSFDVTLNFELAGKQHYVVKVRE